MAVHVYNLSSVEGGDGGLMGLWGLPADLWQGLSQRTMAESDRAGHMFSQLCTCTQMHSLTCAHTQANNFLV